MTNEQQNKIYSLQTTLQFGLYSPLDLYLELDLFFKAFREAGLSDDVIKEGIKSIQDSALLLKRANKEINRAFQLLNSKE